MGGGPSGGKSSLVFIVQPICFPYGLNGKFNVLIVDQINRTGIFCPGFAV